jgi:hypothetical protein
LALKGLDILACFEHLLAVPLLLLVFKEVVLMHTDKVWLQGHLFDLLSIVDGHHMKFGKTQIVAFIEGFEDGADLFPLYEGGIVVEFFRRPDAFSFLTRL